MKIHYDSKSAQWYQTYLDTAVTFGRTALTLPKQAEKKEDPAFDLKLKNGKAGPLIGIMTARKADGTISGNSRLFIQLQKRLEFLHGLSFIFSPDGMNGSIINGFAYMPKEHVWKRMKFPLPDLVYNRIPFRKAEKEEYVRAIFADLKEKGIPFFNPCFLDKYLLHTLFQNNMVLKDFLPATELIVEEEKLKMFIKKHRSVYLKPAQSSKGKGIFRIRMEFSGEISFESLSGRKTYLSFTEFWKEHGKSLLEKKYIVQEEIPSAQFHDKRYDFRILAHADQDGYQVTGIGIRQSQEQELTTHIPNGGKLLPYDLFQTDECDQFIQRIVVQIGKTLTSSLGYFGEFSIDAGISETGKYYIYEVNSKPMRFDEPNIEERQISQLCRLFFQLTGFD